MTYAKFTRRPSPVPGFTADEAEMAVHGGGTVFVLHCHGQNGDRKVQVIGVRDFHSAGFPLLPDEARALADELNRAADDAQGITKVRR